MALTKISRGLLSTGVSDSSDATAITIDSSENVGISTTSPDEKLDVAGNVVVNNGGFYKFGDGTVRIYGETSTDIMSFVTNDSERMRIDSSGHVGIGHTSPDFPLVVRDSTTSNYLKVIAATNGNAGIGFGDDDVELDGGILFKNDTKDLRFFKGGFTEAMRIDSVGNFMLGTTTTSVTGSGMGFQVANHGANKGQFNIGTSAYQTEKTISLYSNAVTSYRFYVTAGGEIAAVNTIITSLSDERLKENIRDLDDGLDKVMQLKPRKFDWKEGQGKNISNDRGFISQEFETVFPDMVGEWDDETQEEKYKTINANIIPTLVKAIQELSAKVEELESKIDG